MQQGKVLNKHVHGVPAGAKYIGRGSPFGNKFVIGRDGDRDGVCEKHDLDLARDRARLKKLDELAGCDVVCFCSPSRCHGDTLVKLAAMPFEERLVWALRVIAKAEGTASPDQPAPGGAPRGTRRQLR
jgi:hypothetical protein